MFESATRRPATPHEIQALVAFDTDRRTFFSQNEAAANELLAISEPTPTPKNFSHFELAAWTTVGNVNLNLDEVITKQ